MKRLRRFLRLARTPVSIALESPPWTAEDGATLRGWLASPSGVRLGAVLRDRLTREAWTAIRSTSDREWRCDRVAGMQEMLAIIDSLAPSPTVDSSRPDDDRPSDTLDWMYAGLTRKQP